MKRKPLSKAYRSGYSDLDVHQNAADIPNSLSLEDSHQFARQLLRQAMQEAVVSNQEMEQVIELVEEFSFD